MVFPEEGYIVFSNDEKPSLRRQHGNRPQKVDALHCALKEHEAGQNFYRTIKLGKKSLLVFGGESFSEGWLQPSIDEKSLIEKFNRDDFSALDVSKAVFSDQLIEVLTQNSSLFDLEKLNQYCLLVTYSKYRTLAGDEIPTYIADSWRRLSDLSAQEVLDLRKGLMRLGFAACMYLLKDTGLHRFKEGYQDKIGMLKALRTLGEPLTIDYFKKENAPQYLLKYSSLDIFRGSYAEVVRTQCNLSVTFFEVEDRIKDGMAALPLSCSFGDNVVNHLPVLDPYYFEPRDENYNADYKNILILDQYGLRFNHEFFKKYKLYCRKDGKKRDPDEPEAEVFEQPYEIVDVLGLKDRAEQKDPRLIGKVKVMHVTPLQILLSVLGELFEHYTILHNKPVAMEGDFLNFLWFNIMQARYMVTTGEMRPEAFAFGKIRIRMLMPFIYYETANGYEPKRAESDNYDATFYSFRAGAMMQKLIAAGNIKYGLPLKFSELHQGRIGSLIFGLLATEIARLLMTDNFDYFGDGFIKIEDEEARASAVISMAPMLYHSWEEFFGTVREMYDAEEIAAWLANEEEEGDDEDDDWDAEDDWPAGITRHLDEIEESFDNFEFFNLFADYCSVRRPTHYDALVPVLLCLNSEDVKKATTSGLKGRDLRCQIRNHEENLEVLQDKIEENKQEHDRIGTAYYIAHYNYTRSLDKTFAALTIKLPEVSTAENEAFFVPGVILHRQDETVKFMPLTEVAKQDRTEPMYRWIMDSTVFVALVGHTQYNHLNIKTTARGCGLCCDIAEAENLREYFYDKVGEFPLRPHNDLPQLAITGASRNLKTTELTEVLFAELPKKQELPDTYLGLESLLEFNWRLSVGKEFISDEEFKLLLENAGKIIKLRNQYVFADPKILKHYQELRDSLSRVNLHLLLLATLTGSFDGSPVQLGSRLAKAKKQIFTSGDTSLPRGLNRELKLRPYQVRGYSWLLRNARSGIGSILADDMGLGKTVQLTALLQKLKEDGALKDAPALIVAPSSVLYNWKNELKRFAPLLRVYLYHGPQRSHERLIDFDVVISSYGTIRTSYEKLADINFGLIAADEAQKIKNYASLTVKAVKTLKSRRFVALTGTPVENSLSDYWSIMDFVNAGLLGSQNRFNTEIALPIEKHRDPEVIERFKRMTGPFILRRVKTDKSIINDLPDKMVTDEFCTLTPVQASLYQAALDDIMERIKNPVNTTLERSALVLKLMGSLKQICNTPLQYVSGAEGEIEHNYTAEDSGKVRHLFSLGGRLMENGHRTLIFTQYTVMGELLQAWMKKELKVDVPFIRGSLSPKQRQDLVDKFQAGDMPFLMLSLKAGGTGINLTQADAVIHFDLWWNPAVEEQATDRAYRIGQHNNVQVYRFITANTFEEKINAIIQSKKELSNLTVVSGSKWLGELSNDELADLFALTREELS
ncbi:MAG: hypothetical protein IAB19_03940 [Proteobacteria bacterium]|uniref:ATP-dependent helicase n=1 Tax=Candidatus Avisuccinivibrio stercorigallinarum TaxID=2840704 RepID=A0A9D9DBU6_9GAMM|nr:hypothetical protein [Candidatus Avisuccinivibrio stercorigallinarum]